MPAIWIRTQIASKIEDNVNIFVFSTSLLREPWTNITLDFTSIIHAFQNLSYIGELRQRWNEIKKLQNTHSPLTVAI